MQSRNFIRFKNIYSILSIDDVYTYLCRKATNKENKDYRLCVFLKWDRGKLIQIWEFWHFLSWKRLLLRYSRRCFFFNWSAISIIIVFKIQSENSIWLFFIRFNLNKIERHFNIWILFPKWGLLHRNVKMSDKSAIGIGVRRLYWIKYDAPLFNRLIL